MTSLLFLSFLAFLRLLEPWCLQLSDPLILCALNPLPRCALFMSLSRPSLSAANASQHEVSQEESLHLTAPGAIDFSTTRTSIMGQPSWDQLLLTGLLFMLLLLSAFINRYKVFVP